jgi:hypothetical protein
LGGDLMMLEETDASVFTDESVSFCIHVAALLLVVATLFGW